ncbi:hypothetical protein 7AX3_70 [uncultured Caudovirales phage]|uniref:Uncharacterized protein n=1 Tax=uncultured Caudovirales phage TaxID=2100421 RepID=A0A2H4JF61_9CAUD|nr:hypothetical protein 7AX3_70 [uncultured Caudovirales phage]ASN72923.1 hypothetical protein 7F1_6 [uncultured Caudovirales phage]
MGAPCSGRSSGEQAMNAPAAAEQYQKQQSELDRQRKEEAEH